MQKIFLIFFSAAAVASLFFGLSAGSVGVAAQDKTPDKKHVRELEAIYREYDAATKKGDLKTYEKYLDETFEMETPDGQKISRREILEMMKLFSDSIVEITEAASKIEKVRVTGGNYFLEVSSLMKGKFRMADGKISNLEIRTQSTDVWIKTGKGWKEIFQTGVGSKILVEGKETPM